MFATVEELQAALDGWVSGYNTARPHHSCGGRPPVERFRLADRSVIPDDSAAAPAPARVSPAAPVKRPAGVSRWVDARGKISLAEFSYNVGATYAGEPVEVVVAGGLVDILHAAAGVVSFADTPYAAGRRWARTAVDVAIVAASVQLSKDGQVIRVHPIRHDRTRELGAFANPKGRPRHKNSAIGNTG
jgi:hypothetical protein